MKYYASAQLSENMHETPEGFLICLGVPIARTGWYIYGKNEIPKEANIEPGEDGKIHVYRDSKDVFLPDTIASFEGKPFTIGHPPDDFVDPSNWKELAKGVMQNVRKAMETDEDGEQSLLADILITDEEAIRLVKSGIREVSCGYETIYEPLEKGKCKQTNIIGNHLALVKLGRAGPGYAIHDHKYEEVKMSKLKEKLKLFFSKAIDEAVEENEKEKTVAKDDAGKVVEQANGSVSFDALHKMVNDLGDKVSGLLVKDADKMEEGKKEDPEKKEEAKDEGGSSVEERLSKVEGLLAELMESMKTKASSPQQVGDSKEEEEEDEEITEDTASRAEIIAPGIAYTKDVKLKALKAFVQTRDGKSLLESLSGGKVPSFDSEEQVSHLFIATSEILKTKKGTGLEQTKNVRAFDCGDKVREPMTPEKMNEMNKEFYAKLNK